jgi:hypothetical protein
MMIIQEKEIDNMANLKSPMLDFSLFDKQKKLMEAKKLLNIFEKEIKKLYIYINDRSALC